MKLGYVLVLIQALLLLAIAFSGCAWVGMAAAGFVGTVGGNLVSDHMEGKAKPNAEQ